MKIGFIGCGNMAKAIICGIIEKKIEERSNIFASDINIENLNKYCSENRINALSSNNELIEECSVIIFCIKPQNFDEVLSKIDTDICGKLFISIAAGTNIEKIEKLLNKSAKIARIMPNLNATVSASVSSVCFNKNCTIDDKIITKKIFESIGKVYELDERFFSAFSASCCCSPAFTFIYINAICEGAKKCGLDEKIALESAANAVIGSAKMLLNSDKEPGELVKMVCSPGGTTIEGVKSLIKDEFEKVVICAVEASYKRDKELLEN